MVICKTNSWPEYDCYKDYFYAKKLRFTRHDKLIDKKTVAAIKRIEEAAYPESLRGYTEVKTVKDLVERLGCCDAAQIEYYLEDDMYLLCSRHYNCVEIYDFASGTRKYTFVFRIKQYLYDRFCDDDIYLQSRETTSYPIMKLFEKRGSIRIISDEESEVGGEKFHKLHFKFVRSGADRISNKNPKKEVVS